MPFIKSHKSETRACVRPKFATATSRFFDSTIYRIRLLELRLGPNHFRIDRLYLISSGRSISFSSVAIFPSRISKQRYMQNNFLRDSIETEKTKHGRYTINASSICRTLKMPLMNVFIVSLYSFSPATACVVQYQHFHYRADAHFAYVSLIRD